VVLNLTALRAETRRLLGSTSTHFFADADIDAELNIAQRVLAEELPGHLIANSLYTDQDQAITNGVSTYTLDSAIKRVFYVKTFGYYAHKVDFTQDTQLKTNNYRIPIKSQPLYAEHHGNKIEIYPTPETGDPNMTFTGIEEPTDMTTGNDVPPFGSNVHYLLTLYAAARLFQKDKEFEKANNLLSELYGTIERHNRRAGEVYPGTGRNITESAPKYREV